MQGVGGSRAIALGMVAMVIFFVAMSQLGSEHTPPLGQLLVYAHRAACGGACEQQHGAHAAGSLPALRALASSGICRFDVDSFRTADGTLVVGHPTEVQFRLRLPSSPERMTLKELRAQDGGQIAALRDFMAEATRLCGSTMRQGGVFPALLVEPKGAAMAAADTTVRELAAMAQEEIGPGKGVLAVWLESDQVASVLQKPLAPLYAIKARQLSPEGRQLTRADVRRAGGWLGTGPYWKLLTHDFVREAHGLGQRVMTWVVNEDDAVHTALLMGVDAVVSDDPLMLTKKLATTR